MTEITTEEISSTRVPFLTRLKWVGKPGKTNAERLQDFPEVKYQSSAIGYETVTGKPHTRQVNTTAATNTTRHSIQSAGGQKLVIGSSCHEYLAMDSMYDAVETLEENWDKKTNRIDT
ncbi:MAG: hypothetical protein R3309_13750, partial [Reinekea sp.]|nr:hypothetical protein [Reinekea sp.]